MLLIAQQLFYSLNIEEVGHTDKKVQAAQRLNQKVTIFFPVTGPVAKVLQTPLLTQQNIHF